MLRRRRFIGRVVFAVMAAILAAAAAWYIGAIFPPSVRCEGVDVDECHRVADAALGEDWRRALSLVVTTPPPQWEQVANPGYRHAEWAVRVTYFGSGQETLSPCYVSSDPAIYCHVGEDPNVAPRGSPPDAAD